MTYLFKFSCHFPTSESKHLIFSTEMSNGTKNESGNANFQVPLNL